jgi:hypothetical protein
MAHIANKRKTNEASFLSSFQMLLEVLGSTVSVVFLAELNRWWGEVDVNLMADDHSMIVPPRRVGQER